MKKNLTRLAFVILTVWSLWYLNLVLSVKSWHGIDQTRALYFQPENTIDVVCMGSSHVHCDIDTGILWHKYGITAFDYSAAEQPLWSTYYYLLEVCKYQKPKVVVLDLYSAAIIGGPYHYDWLNQNLYGMRPSLNKIRLLFASAEPERILDFFPSFINYHDRYTELTKEDWTYPLTARETLLSFKGFTPYLNRVPQERPVLDQDLSGNISVKSEMYLTRIIEYCQENDIGLFLVVTPYITNEYHELAYNRIRDIAAAYGVPFNSTNYDYDEMGLDFETDFNDGSHLNYWGAYKFTEYLGKELTERFDLPDHRGDPRYQSWQDNFEEIAEYVRENEGEEVIVW